MGVKGLTKYLRSNPETRTAWDDSFVLADTRLVIDGNSMMYSLFQTSGKDFGEPDLRHGGQYAEFYARVQYFIYQLHSRGVRPIVIMDGVQEGNVKLATLKNSYRSYLKGKKLLISCTSQTDVHRAQYQPVSFPLPCWRGEVMYEALVACGVAVIRADKEADVGVAALANLLECPVVSGDSDFFIFDIPGGVIHRDELLELLSRTAHGPLRVRLFKRSLLSMTIARLLSIGPGEDAGARAARCERLLSLAASLTGNDFVKMEDFPPNFPLYPPRRPWQYPPLLPAFRWLIGQKCETPEEGLKAVETSLRLLGDSRETVSQKLDTLRYSVAYYDVTTDQAKSEAHGLLQTENHTTTLRARDQCRLENNQFPPWLVRSFRLAELPSQPMTVSQPDCAISAIRSGIFLEDPSMVPISRADIYLRKAIYGIVLAAGKLVNHEPKPVVKELVHTCGSATELELVEVEAINGLEIFGPYPSLGEIDDMSSDNKKKLVLECLNSYIDEVRCLRDGWQLLVAALRHWVQRSREKDAQPTHQVFKCHVRALLVGMINGCKSDEECRNGPCSNECLADVNLANLVKFNENSPLVPPSHCTFEGSRCADGKLRKSVIHIINQWQRIVKGAMDINTLLNSPLPRPLLHKMYDGLHSYDQLCPNDCHNCSDGRCSTEFKLSKDNADLLEELYRAVAKDLPI